MPTPTPSNLPRGCYSVQEFCNAHSIGRNMLYELWSRGEGPRFMHVGRRRLIAVEAAEEWRRRMEAQTADTIRARGEVA